VVLASLVALGCGDPTGPDGGIVRFVDDDINLGLTTAGQFQVRNEGSQAVGPVSFRSGGALENGEEVGGADLRIFGGSIPLFEPGSKLGFGFVIDPRGLPPGPYEMFVYVVVNGQDSDRAKIRWGFGRASTTRAAVVRILPPDLSNVVQGDTVQFGIEAFTASGGPVQTFEAAWYVLPTFAGSITDSGLFVPDSARSMRIVASIGNVRDEVFVNVLPGN
jgi:hypothetical protein